MTSQIIPFTSSVTIKAPAQMEGSYDIDLYQGLNPEKYYICDLTGWSYVYLEGYFFSIVFDAEIKGTEAEVIRFIQENFRE